MVINIDGVYPLFNFIGDLPAYSSYKVQLVSRFSKLPIDNNFRDINLELVTSGTNFFIMRATTSMFDLREKEVSGYYDCILIGKDELDRDFTISTTLCKVINNLDRVPSLFDIEYSSEYDDNHQFIWFNNEL